MVDGTYQQACPQPPFLGRQYESRLRSAQSSHAVSTTTRDHNPSCRPGAGLGAMLFKNPGAAMLLLLSVQLVRSVDIPAVTHEFTAYRMQQYNLQQEKHGCRGAIVVAEGQWVDDPGLNRRCVIMKLPDFTMHRYREALRQNAAAVLILLPSNISAVPQDVIQGFMVTEAETLRNQTLIPVYVAPEDEQLLFMYDQLKMAAAAKGLSILVRVFSSMVITSGFQIIVSNNSPIKPVTDTAIVTLEGVLPGKGEDLPTIVITAHYDSFGLAPWLSYGADSNGSGVAILLELIRLFHQLYSDPRSHAPYHLLFSLTGGGKYNFQGTKRWIEENMDHAESSLLHDSVAFVLCLDTLANGDGLFLHVSRPPKPGTPQYAFIKELEQVVSSRFPWVKLGMVHKKINLGESTVAWEHERYGMRRIPGFTLSHLEDPRSEQRGSILDTISQVDIRKLKRNAVIIAEALARFMYNLSDKGSPKELQVFKGQMEIQDSRLSALMSFLSSVPRATQLLDKEPALLLLVNTLEQQLSRYLQQVLRHTFRPDRREPEITFFDQMNQPMMMYRVKPAAFDLFLGGCITAYLGIIYFAVQQFSQLYTKLTKMAMRSKQQ
ncbi:nicalin-1 [Megalops cyprinoides]|uniref:nicalin-1 n=1 Tax=Megalops cyprinoides TaxID=118141 RepID=UPI0018655A5F|nr:nicalin-1 [Megalops cyprinoides]